MIEELTENEIRAQMETNLFGALWITRAALPIMRAQGSMVGAYHASKRALERPSRRCGRSSAPRRSRSQPGESEKRLALWNEWQPRALEAQGA